MQNRPLRVEIPKFAYGMISPTYHPCQVSCRSVEGFLISGGLNIGVFHWQGSSPLQQFCTTVQTVIIMFLGKMQLALVRHGLICTDRQPRVHAYCNILCRLVSVEPWPTYRVVADNTSVQRAPLKLRLSISSASSTTFCFLNHSNFYVVSNCPYCVDGRPDCLSHAMLKWEAD